MGEGTNGLTDERVREIAGPDHHYPSLREHLAAGGTYPATLLTNNEARSLAREVLALRGTLGREQAIAEGLRGTIATITRQRDDAVELAREAVGDLETATRTGYVDQRDMLDLATRLAWIIGDESPTPERDDG